MIKVDGAAGDPGLERMESGQIIDDAGLSRHRQMRAGPEIQEILAKGMAGAIGHALA